jgi:hypothetical protein
MAMMDGVDNDKIDDAAMDEINVIVDGYGGLCAESASVPSDYVLDFDEWFELGKHPVHRH